MLEDGLLMRWVVTYLAQYGQAASTTVATYGNGLVVVRHSSRAGELEVLPSYFMGERTDYVGYIRWWDAIRLAENALRDDGYPFSVEPHAGLDMLNRYIAEATCEQGSLHGVDYRLQYAPEASMRPKLTVGSFSLLAAPGSEAEALFRSCLLGEVPVSVALDWWEDNHNIYVG